jgi:hypothetical protein
MGKIMRLKFLHETGQEAEVIVYGQNVIFTTASGGTVKGGVLERDMMISVVGILKDHPDLANKPVEVIRAEGVRRFKEKLFGLPSWEARKNYLKEDLARHGYKLIEQLLPGQRVKRVN